MKWMWDNYAPIQLTGRTNMLPLLASLQELKICPALFSSRNDILHDEGVAYGRKLDEACVPPPLQNIKVYS